MGFSAHLILIIMSVAIAQVSTSAFAAAAPHQLYNKTITLTWAEQKTARDLLSGKVVGWPNAYKVTIYISSAGHVFTRLSGSNSRSGNAVRADTGPRGDKTIKLTGQASDRNYGGTTYHFEAGRMVSDEAFESGARRKQITFDSAFQSCRLSLIEGKENGQHIRHKGYNGRLYEFLSISTSNENCSIQAGNGFAH